MTKRYSYLPSTLLLTLLLPFTNCTRLTFGSPTPNDVAKRPAELPKTIRLPRQLNEASGLSIHNNRFYWHNDSGDGPYLYVTDRHGGLQRIDTLTAGASDWEDMTTDPAGHFYLGDFGNNRGRRTHEAIYRYHPATQATDTILFHYPNQDGGGREQPGNHNCEAMVFQGSYLHLFTKDKLGKGSNYYTYHYRLPARPGDYEAELVDSLYLPRRVVTAAALDTVRKQLVFTAYNFNNTLGFIPNGSASLYTINNYPEGRFLRGKLSKERISWGLPTQFEAVDFYDENWLYIASEATVARPRAVAKLRRRKR